MEKRVKARRHWLKYDLNRLMNKHDKVHSKACKSTNPRVRQ